MALSPNERTVAYGGEGGIVLWALDGRRPIARAVPSSGGFAQATFSADDRHLLLTGGNRPVEVWELGADEPVSSPQLEGSAIGFVFWGGRSTAFSLDQETQQLEGLDPATLEPTGVTFGRNTSVVGAGSPDDPPLVRVYEVETGRLVVELGELVPLAGEGGIVSAVGFSPDGSRLVAAADSGAATVWDTETWKPIEPPLSGGAGNVVKAQFSPDGRWLVTIAVDGTIRLRDPMTLQPDGPPARRWDRRHRRLQQRPIFHCGLALSDHRRGRESPIVGSR